MKAHSIQQNHNNNPNFQRLYMVKSNPIFNNLFEYVDKGATKVARKSGVKYIEDKTALKNSALMELIRSYDDNYLQKLSKKTDVFIQYYEYEAPEHRLTKKIVTHREAKIWALHPRNGRVVRDVLCITNDFKNISPIDKWSYEFRWQFN